jgi:hypothetical protein
VNTDDVQEYVECMKKTEKAVVRLKRQADMINKNLEFQD